MLNLWSHTAFSFLIIILLTGIALGPAIQVVASTQDLQPQIQQQTQQPNQIGVSQIIKQIADKVAAANPGTNATSVEQVLTQLAKQNAQASGETNAIEKIRQISSQITIYPYGTVSQSLAGFANQPSTLPVVGIETQPPTEGNVPPDGGEAIDSSDGDNGDNGDNGGDDNGDDGDNSGGNGGNGGNGGDGNGDDGDNSGGNGDNGGDGNGDDGDNSGGDGGNGGDGNPSGSEDGE
jgi:hypothetical protein